MWIYWVLFFWPALVALSSGETRTFGVENKLAIWAFALVLTLVIGLRFEVGTDWFHYLSNLDKTVDLTWGEILAGAEPAYTGISKIASTTGTEILLVNLVCAIIFVGGLLAFCRRMSDPWLALTIAVPYMAIVMAMNYTRQGAAFGLVLWGLLALHDGQMRRFVVFVVLATLFHRSAAILMPLGAFVTIRNRWWVIAWIGVASLIVYYTYIAESQEFLVANYLEQEMASEGALIRVIMNAVPAVVFLLTRHRFGLTTIERDFWTWISVAALLFFPALWISPSSTAVDRVALYFMPIQLIGYAHLYAASNTSGSRWIYKFLVVLVYAFVQYVWLNYSFYAQYWLPYRFFPFEAF